MGPGWRSIVQLATRSGRRSQVLRSRLSRSQSDVKRLKAALAHAESLSVTDGLTGLNNRRAFDLQLSDAIERGRRGVGLPLVLAIFDLDHFKLVNDKFGHPVGDEVLKKVSVIIKEHARTSDFVARYGGEEFAFILQATKLAGASTFIERFRECLAEAELVAVGSESIRITASIGIARWNGSETSAELLARADLALYVAKKSGRNRIAIAPVHRT